MLAIEMSRWWGKNSGGAGSGGGSDSISDFVNWKIKNEIYFFFHETHSASDTRVKILNENESVSEMDEMTIILYFMNF
jgi:hypothetical protein